MRAEVFGVALDPSHFRADVNPQTVMGQGAINDSGGVLFVVNRSTSKAPDA
jgi:hypothetical protein